EAIGQKMREKQGEQRKQDVERGKELDSKKSEADKSAEEKIAELQRKLDAAQSVAEIGPLVQAALASTKIAQVQGALDKVVEKAKASPNDQLTTWQKQLGDRIEELRALPPRLEKVAKESKQSVVAIQVTSYLIPKNQ